MFHQITIVISFVGICSVLKNNKKLDEFRHIAIIENPSGKILTVGFNFGDIRAEHAALINLRNMVKYGKIKKHKVKRLSMIVYRINNKLELKMSRPCDKCTKLIHSDYAASIRRIIWSTGHWS